MWVIAKFKINQLYYFKDELKKILKNPPKYFLPKFKYYKFYKNKKIRYEKYLLGDYIFCYHEDFNNPQIKNKLNFLKGTKYFLNNFKNSQIEIEKFILNCKKYEEADGYIKSDFYRILENKEYKFISGPFSDMIFKVLKKQKNKVKILIGNLNTTINIKSNYYYNRI